jgi:methyltransferase (TIGR00027 family)
VAALRAAHRVLDLEPRIMDDPIAIRLLDAETRAAVEAHAGRFEETGPRHLRAHLVLRGRWAEERLEAAAARGVRQYVILGAGLDTFAWRRPAWAGGLRIFEVDHPASQADKRARLAAAGLPEPPDLAFAAVDFESTGLAEGLAAAGFDAAAPAFVAWLGVLMYLEPAAAEATFRWAAGLAPGSEVAFTFAPAGHAEALADLAASLGEPWLTRWGVPELQALLPSLGFSELGFPPPEELAARYFHGRADGLPAPKRGSLGWARV